MIALALCPSETYLFLIAFTISSSSASFPEIKIQFAGNEADEDEIVNAIKNKYVSEGHRASAIKSLQIYLKPEENAAYYVINQKSMGMVPLF